MKLILLLNTDYTKSNWAGTHDTFVKSKTMILGQHITDNFTQSHDSELGATTGEIFPCFSLNGKGGDFLVILLVNL